MKSKIYFYPENLDIIKIINQDTLLTPIQKLKCIKYQERILYPINKIIWDSKYNKSFEKSEYISLYYNILKQIFGYPLRDINVLEFLIRNNIIVKSKKGYSTTNNTCNSYKLSDIYINNYYTYKVYTDNTIIFHLNNINNQAQSNLIINYIINNIKELNIDYQSAKIKLWGKIKEIKKLNKNSGDSMKKIGAKIGAREENSIKKSGEKLYNNNYYNLLYSYVGMNCVGDVPEAIFDKETDYITEDFVKNYVNDIKFLFDIEDDNKIKEIIKNWDMNINKIDNKDWDNSTSTNTGRFFNNISQMPRELRSTLYNNDGEELVELDIANSQPFLFNQLINENIDLDKSIFNEYEDVKLYKELTEKGKLYDYIIKKWNIKIDRHLFKKHFFGKIFYCKTKSNYRYEYSKLFMKEFPHVFELIIELKKGDYTNLAKQLQKRESSLIVYQIGKILMQKNIWFITVHDSIICKESDSKEVNDIMKKIFNKNKLNPTIKIKKL